MPENSVDDQELAKVLSDITDTTPTQANEPSDTSTSSGLNFEETSTVSTELPPIVPIGSPVAPAPLDPPALSVPDFTPAAPVSTNESTTTEPTGELASIKKDALNELRPLVDKLNVSTEEKFDTYLLLIRSTDDASLLGPAHEAAKAISDDARRAEALLDIIKEVDYLTQNKAA